MINFTTKKSRRIVRAVTLLTLLGVQIELSTKLALAREGDDQLDAQLTYFVNLHSRDSLVALSKHVYVEKRAIFLKMSNYISDLRSEYFVLSSLRPLIEGTQTPLFEKYVHSNYKWKSEMVRKRLHSSEDLVSFAGQARFTEASLALTESCLSAALRYVSDPAQRTALKELVGNVGFALVTGSAQDSQRVLQSFAQNRTLLEQLSQSARVQAFGLTLLIQYEFLKLSLNRATNQ